MAEFNADLLARLSIQFTIHAIAVTAIYWCYVTSELFVAFTGIGRSQFMKALQSLFIQRFTGGAHGLLHERGVVFVSGQQVAAAGRRRIPSEL